MGDRVTGAGPGLQSRAQAGSPHELARRESALGSELAGVAGGVGCMAKCISCNSLNTEKRVQYVGGWDVTILTRKHHQRTFSPHSLQMHV